MANRVSVPKRTTLCFVSSSGSGRDISDRPTSERAPTPSPKITNVSTGQKFRFRSCEPAFARGPLWTVWRAQARNAEVRAVDHKVSKPGGQMSAGGTLSTAVGALGLFGQHSAGGCGAFPGAADQGHRAG